MIMSSSICFVDLFSSILHIEETDEGKFWIEQQH